MDVTTTMWLMIDEELRQGIKTIPQIARTYGIDAKSIKDRNRKKKYVIARRHVEDPWWPESPELEKAKADYDAGLVEICTGREGDWFLLYCIPRKEPDTKRAAYFSRIFGDY